jgi:outer membrane receptor for ferrienterochelin and colicins
VPRNVVIAGFGYTKDRLEMDVLGRWQSSYRDFQISSAPLLLQPVEVRNYITLSARIGYRLTDNFTAAVTAQQFNESRLLQAAGPPVERRIIAGVTARF